MADDYMGWFSSGLMYFSYVHFGDYDHDGDQDLLLSYWQGLRLMLNQTITGIEEDSAAENGHVASQPLIVKTYPNPFNAQTKIAYSLAQRGNVSIDIFDMLGRRIAQLSEGAQEAGNHEIIWDATGIPTGIYFYRLTAGEYQETKRMLLLK